MTFDWSSAFLWGWYAGFAIAIIGVCSLIARLIECETGFPVWASMLLIAVVVAVAVCGGLGVL